MLWPPLDTHPLRVRIYRQVFFEYQIASTVGNEKKKVYLIEHKVSTLLRILKEVATHKRYKQYTQTCKTNLKNWHA